MPRYELSPMTYDKAIGWHQKARRMNDGDNLDRPAPVTREEYEGLFNAIARLTSRIEALEAFLLFPDRAPREE